jgi:peptidyl-prolyl cis-trans isomerase SurA
MLYNLYRVILFLCFFSYSSFVLANERLLDQVLAVVNSQVITQSQLNQQMRLSPGNSRQQGLDQLINIALQKDIAKKAHIVVSSADVDSAIAKIASQNHLSLSQLQKSVVASGMSYTAYRHQIHDQILIHQVQQAFVASKVKITPQDIENARNHMPMRTTIVSESNSNSKSKSTLNTKYHVIDLLISSDQVAKELLRKIRSGGNPEKILNNNPDVKIADLGFRSLSQLPSIFVNSVQSLSPGQFSDPVKAPNGVHIVSVIAVQGGRPASHISSVRLTPEQMAYQLKFEEALQKWLQTLRSQSYIKIVS